MQPQCTLCDRYTRIYTDYIHNKTPYVTHETLRNSCGLDN